MITQVLTSGFGGQGVVLAGVVLGQAAVLDGLYAAQAASYGAEARGSACKCGIILSDQPIAYPHVTDVDQDLVKPNPNDPHPLTPVPATSTAMEHFNHRLSANMIFLGAAVGVGNFVSRQSLENAMQKSVPKQHHDVNMKAINLGFQLTNNQQ